MSVECYRESPGKFDSRTLNRKTIIRWTGRMSRQRLSNVQVRRFMRSFPDPVPYATSAYSKCALKKSECAMSCLYAVVPFIELWLRAHCHPDALEAGDVTIRVGPQSRKAQNNERRLDRSGPPCTPSSPCPRGETLHRQGRPQAETETDSETYGRLATGTLRRCRIARMLKCARTLSDRSF